MLTYLRAIRGGNSANLVSTSELLWPSVHPHDLKGDLKGDTLNKLRRLAQLNLSTDDDEDIKQGVQQQNRGILMADGGANNPDLIADIDRIKKIQLMVPGMAAAAQGSSLALNPEREDIAHLTCSVDSIQRSAALMR